MLFEINSWLAHMSTWAKSHNITQTSKSDSDPKQEKSGARTSLPPNKLVVLQAVRQAKARNRYISNWSRITEGWQVQRKLVDYKASPSRVNSQTHVMWSSPMDTSQLWLVQISNHSHNSNKIIRRPCHHHNPLSDSTSCPTRPLNVYSQPKLQRHRACYTWVVAKMVSRLGRTRYAPRAASANDRDLLQLHSGGY